MALQNGKRIELELRRQRVIQLKIAGASERQIAELEGVSQNTIWKDVKAGLKAHADASAEDREELRSLMMMRYERLVMAWWPQAIGGDHRAAEILRGYLADIRTINALDPKVPPAVVVNADTIDQSERLEIKIDGSHLAQALAILIEAGVPIDLDGARPALPAPTNDVHPPQPNP